MAFFARPNLDNTQFKQCKSSNADQHLTLSGQTQIATISGLTLATGTTNSTGVIVTASGASSAFNNYVLTYDAPENVIKLKQSSASGATGIYDGASPTTCTVGGLPAGTSIFNNCIVDIIQCMVAPTVPPILAAPSISSFTLNPNTTLYEAGSSVSLSATACFDLGCIDPLYTGATPTCEDRSYGVSGYTFTCQSVPLSGFLAGSALQCTYNYGSQGIGLGSNTFGVCVNYCCGPQPYYSDCVSTSGSSGQLNPLPAGFCVSTRIITGIYPVYYGKLTSASRPAVTNELITGGTKVVTTSTGTVTVDFDSCSEYTWLAIPSGATNSKTCWYVNASNNGCIASSPTDKYPDECIINIDSGQGCWTGVNYKVYMSKVNWSDPDPIQFRNS